MEQIVLRPSPQWWLVKKSWILVLLVLGLFVPLFIPEISGMGALIWYGGLLVVGVLLLVDYLKTAVYTHWTITAEQIIIYKGILVKTVDYVELYRVNDYKERQNFIESIFGFTSLYIHSTDSSHSSINIYGLKKNPRLVPTIRDLVEKQKADRRIYELANK